KRSASWMASSVLPTAVGPTIRMRESLLDCILKMGMPEDSVTLRKQAHMLACAEHYAAENAIDHWQIDVVAVEGKVGSKPVITHFENAIQ
ncbi:MAG TPA: hypothetical protein VHP14_20950, partial [Anaerolineales bacterium]|nr:hypothetical protein [Anaerolineales bacterium]